MHGIAIDPFDPRHIVFPQDDDVCYLYGDDNGNMVCEVDRIDYEWAVQWRWCWKFSRPDKFYLRRAVRLEYGRNSPVSTLLLHVEIMKRTGILPPTPAHRLVDHRNGSSLICRRVNLRWVTDGMNRRNLRGQAAHDLLEG